MMRRTYKLRLRLRSLFHRNRVEEELSAELHFHLEQLIREKVAKRMTPQEARYAALCELGGVEQIKEECRDMRRVNYIESFLQDLRYGLRMLAKSPGFTAVGAITLALGIGANTAIFSVINAVLLMPLSFPHPERLIQIWETDPHLGFDRDTVSPFNFLDWRSQSHDFAAMATYDYDHFSLTGGEVPVGLRGLRVSADFFRVFEARPLLGREFLTNEDQPGNGHVAVLSYAAWQNYFGGNSGIIGKKIVLDGESYSVIGVMPSRFELPGSGTEIWVTPGFDLKGRSRGSHYLFAVGRLKPGVTLAAARIEADTIARRLAQQYPDSNAHSGILLVPLQEEIVGHARPGLLVLWGAVGLVLLIACANVANLALSRGVTRRKEFAVRSALGAGGARLLRQLLSESVMLAAIGGVLGLVFAHWGIGTVVHTAVIPRAHGITVDVRVLGFTGLLSILTGVLFGLAPALASSSIDLNSTLKESSGMIEAGSGRSRVQSILVVAQVALAMVLLASAGLLVKSLWLLGRVNPGFNPTEVLGMRLTLPESKYPKELERATLFKRVIERIAAIPGVARVGGVNDLPFSGSRTSTSFDIEGIPPRSAEEIRSADRRDVSPDYFKAMGIRLLKGREFTDHDKAGSLPVAIAQ